MDRRYCHECQRELPATEFHRHASRPHGRHEVCKTCRSKLRKAGTERRRQADERTTIRRVAKLIRDGQQVPEPERLIRFAYAHFGGADGVARAMMAVHDDPRSTPMAQMGVLSALYRLLPAADERERLAREEADRRLAAMDREDLELYVEGLERRYCELMRDGKLDEQLVG